MEYDICSIGSALVDLTFKIDDEFVKQIEQKGIVKGGMTLIEKDYAGLTETHYKVLRRLKEVTSYNLELIKKIERLGGDPKQMEMDV